MNHRKHPLPGHPCQHQRGYPFVCRYPSTKAGLGHSTCSPIRPEIRLVVLLLGFLPLFGTGCVIIPVGDLLRGPSLQEQVLSEGAGFWSKEKIALVDISGVLTGRESTNLFLSSPNSVSEIKAQLQFAANDPQVKALVLRISSPGGEVTACDMLHHEVKRVREKYKLPVVACVMDQGVSGGYYIACAADHIFAHPTSVVGSVGVVLHSFDISELMEKVGVVVNPIKSTTMKDLNSMFRPKTAEERKILHRLVDDMYQRFIDVVAEGRANLNREQVVELADGRVVSGSEAAESGLVDSTGYLRDAVEKASELAGVDSPTIVRYTRRAQSGSNIYTRSMPATPAAAELSLRLGPGVFPRAQLYYLWLP